MKELSGRYHMKQSEIAKRLGITQASVSQYLNSTRAGGTKISETFPKIATYAKDIARSVVSGKDKYEWHGVLCLACNDIRSDKKFCEMHGCDICKDRDQALAARFPGNGHI